MRVVTFYLVFLLGGVPAAWAQVGFARFDIPRPDGGVLHAGVWYPTSRAGTPHRLGLLDQSVAEDAPVAAGRHPLVVMSHGNGGSLFSHADTAFALARAGFVAAALDHPGDTYDDHSRATDLADRPRALHALIDAMLHDWPGHAAIDDRAIGAFGFSSGGFTVLVAAGGSPDLRLMDPYCATHPSGFVCVLRREHPTIPGPEPVWQHDPRIRAIVVAAPAIGFTFADPHAGLTGLHGPVQLWQAGDDRVLPSPDSVEPVLAALQRDGTPVELHRVAGADHWDFLAPCSTALAAVAPTICAERSGFDRTAFHAQFDAAVVGFFRRTLRHGDAGRSTRAGTG